MIIKNKIVVITICYLFLMHIFMVIILYKTDILHMIANKIGIGSSRLELSDFYNKLVTHQLRLDKNVPKQSILFFGDSLIQELNVNAVSVNGINYGIGGDTTYGLLQRIQKYQSIANARAIIIAIGINDLRYRSKKDIINNYKKILSDLPDNLPIIISAILPIDEQARKKKLNVAIRGINEELRKIRLTSPKKIYFADFTEKLIDSKGNLRFMLHVGDGVHLSKNGYEIWIQDLKKTLTSVLSNSPDEAKY